MGTYPWPLKRRIMSRLGHLSNDDSMTAVQRMIGADLKTLCMIHLSQKNNHESIVRDMATRLLARTGAQLELSIARQFEATGTFEITRRRPARPHVPPKHAQIPPVRLCTTSPSPHIAPTPHARRRPSPP